MSSVDFKFECGDQVEDIITGFKGTVVSQNHHINNCNQFGVRPRMVEEAGKQSKYPEAQWFDEDDLKAVEAEKRTIPASARSGGPRDNPQF